MRIRSRRECAADRLQFINRYHAQSPREIRTIGHACHPCRCAAISHSLQYFALFWVFYYTHQLLLLLLLCELILHQLQEFIQIDATISIGIGLFDHADFDVSAPNNVGTRHTFSHTCTSYDTLSTICKQAYLAMSASLKSSPERALRKVIAKSNKNKTKTVTQVTGQTERSTYTMRRNSMAVM